MGSAGHFIFRGRDCMKNCSWMSSLSNLGIMLGMKLDNLWIFERSIPFQMSGVAFSSKSPGPWRDLLQQDRNVPMGRTTCCKDQRTPATRTSSVLRIERRKFGQPLFFLSLCCGKCWALTLQSWPSSESRIRGRFVEGTWKKLHNSSKSRCSGRSTSIQRPGKRLQEAGDGTEGAWMPNHQPVIYSMLLAISAISELLVIRHFHPHSCSYTCTYTASTFEASLKPIPTRTST